MTYKKLQPYLICLMGALFYCYDFVLRVLPSAATNHLMTHLQIGASGLGILASMFFYGYAPMQIPSGLLLDRFGPRRLITLSMLLCALSSFCFTYTHSLTLACVTRLFIGFSASFAYIAAVMLASRWFPARVFALIVGLIQLVGSAGAIMGESPFASMVNHLGWDMTNNIVNVVGLGLALVFWLIIRDHPKGNRSQPHQSMKRNIGSRLKTILHKPQTWWIAAYAFCIWAPISIFASFWGVPYLSTLFHTQTTVAAAMVSIIWVGVALGGPFFGWLCMKTARRKLPLYLGSIFCLLSSLVILYWPSANYSIIGVALFFYGVAASAQAVTFGLIHDTIPRYAQGTAVGFNNMAIIAGGLILLPLVGFILDSWPKIVQHGMILYSKAHFDVALSMIPVIAFVGLILAIFFIKETYCQHSSQH